MNNLFSLHDLYIDHAVLTEVRLLYVLFTHGNMRERDGYYACRLSNAKLLHSTKVLSVKLGLVFNRALCRTESTGIRIPIDHLGRGLEVMLRGLSEAI